MEDLLSKSLCKWYERVERRVGNSV
jgi:hypothetical protein